MANEYHLELIKRGVESWNQWRDENKRIEPDLSGADLSSANFSSADLGKVNFSGTNLMFSTLVETNLAEANLSGANLRQADLRRANLRGANLMFASLVQTNLTEADLSNCHIYGISTWSLSLNGAKQVNLVITPPQEATITVDNLEIAQFIYSLLNNRNIREIIDSLTSKIVLIMGRFTPERKIVLDALRDELRNHNYLPILFDFEKPASRDITETVSTLAHLSRFIIADLTDAKSIPQELNRIVPQLPSVPVQPLIHVSGQEYTMFEQFNKYPWVLNTFRYKNISDLLKSLQENIIKPAEEKAQELERIKHN